jgi:hypothetical protein
MVMAIYLFGTNITGGFEFAKHFQISQFLFYMLVGICPNLLFPDFFQVGFCFLGIIPETRI